MLYEQILMHFWVVESRLQPVQNTAITICRRLLLGDKPDLE